MVEREEAVPTNANIPNYNPNDEMMEVEEQVPEPADSPNSSASPSQTVPNQEPPIDELATAAVANPDSNH